VNIFAVLLTLLAGFAGVQAAPAAPAIVCASCHRVESLTQPATSMGHALEAVTDCTILRSNPKLALRHGAYSYQIVREGDRSIYSVTDGHQTLTVPIAWAFGLGSAGQTYVYQWNGHWYESSVTYFRALRGADLTLGFRSRSPRNLEEAAGRIMTLPETRDCFNCHATNAVHQGRLQFERLTPGVQCQRCHGDTAAHVEAMKTGDVKRAAMPQLGKLTTDQLSDFCGQCHRTAAQINMNGPHDINNIRFQPYRLANSKCYDASDRRISCTACHDPHREVEHGAEAYDAKCLACHRTAKRCSVSPKDCVTCHMPKYELEGAHNRFTDHQIRIVRAGEPYPD
jgi:Cytochrome c554 and c-prime